ncbi:large subunit ribosomal protein L22 [Methanomicrobium sp. W14]|uniref:50S ribosomal protein L22 n=1 Tax=Methanomicrobium sp. W14 TaxID=2817839 RepID=UPI001AE1DD36|nr:50S ribosomal protein L22 [Methanomicrobium sp. W14]MBP2133166.1 large subunit ribosomal protein L22 [Methanomicrobium sp. W14]
MARTNYSLKMDGDKFARAKANELPCSPKHSIEIAKFIRGKNTKKAIAYLEDVVAVKKAIPFKTFNMDVAHKRGLDKWDAGRYPVKASAEFIRLLKSVEKNAEYIGLDTEKLEILSVSANRGRRTRGVFPRAMGRATPKFAESVNVEIIVKEVE